jgi:hypothetical protein
MPMEKNVNAILFLLIWLCSIVEARYDDVSSIAFFAQDLFGYSWSFILPYEF